MSDDRAGICPSCNRPTEGKQRPLCTPLSCDAWSITAKFNHDTREWESIDDVLSDDEREALHADLAKMVRERRRAAGEAGCLPMA